MQQTQWAPRTAAIAGCGVAGIVMAIGCVTLVTDLPGRIFTGIAAAGLILFASVSWRARPKLAITPDGLVVRGWLRTQLLRRPQVKIIRIVEFRRIGRKLRLLEIETVDDQLRIFSRWDLGTDPLEVLDALTAAGYAGPQVSEPGS
ncbi:PH domain-containing protein [Mycobacterium xenopi]|uniref:PH domain-containing protein n=1 Tax=Mycobacterium xenopi TaxID=1789 RepID=UPI000586D63C|nr:PH domain-containing protein [Mycobacterium xenopi]